MNASSAGSSGPDASSMRVAVTAVTGTLEVRALLHEDRLAGRGRAPGRGGPAIRSASSRSSPRQALVAVQQHDVAGLHLRLGARAGRAPRRARTGVVRGTVASSRETKNAAAPATSSTRQHDRAEREQRLARHQRAAPGGGPARRRAAPRRASRAAPRAARRGTEAPVGERVDRRRAACRRACRGRPARRSRRAARSRAGRRSS